MAVTMVPFTSRHVPTRHVSPMAGPAVGMGVGWLVTTTTWTARRAGAAPAPQATTSDIVHATVPAASARRREARTWPGRCWTMAAMRRR